MSSILRYVVAAVAVALALAAAPQAASAQGQVYAPAELTVTPKIASPAEAARLVQLSYPEPLRRAGINGTVEVEFVVGPDGKVENNSIEVIAASPPTLGEPAKRAVSNFKFKPGQVAGAPVRTKVAIPLVYKAQ